MATQNVKLMNYTKCGSPDRKISKRDQEIARKEDTRSLHLKNKVVASCSEIGKPF